jgi:hypothetical protein
MTKAVAKAIRPRPATRRVTATLFVLLASPHEDLTVVPAEEAQAHALDLANEMGAPISVRDISTDRVIRYVRPTVVRA